MDEDNILLSVKQALGGLTEDYTAFDGQICMFIKGVFDKLDQIGVESDSDFSFRPTSKWSQYLTEGKLLESAKTYMALNVKMLFDPPTNSSVMEAVQEQIRELEWRMQVMVESRKITAS